MLDNPDLVSRDDNDEDAEDHEDETYVDRSVRLGKRKRADDANGMISVNGANGANDHFWSEFTHFYKEKRAAWGNNFSTSGWAR